MNKILKQYLALSEAKHTLSGSRLDFKNDEDVEEVILTRTGPSDVADLIAKISVLNVFVDMSKEKDKVDNHNATADEEDKETYDFSIKEFADRASIDAYTFMNQVKEAILGMADSEFEPLIKHFFPDLEKVAESKASETAASLDSNGKEVKVAKVNMGTKPMPSVKEGDMYRYNGNRFKVVKVTLTSVRLDQLDKEGKPVEYHSGKHAHQVSLTKLTKEYRKE